MNPTLISALAALAGALIGGLASLGSTWLAHAVQSRARSRDRDMARREALFSDFINEASRLYGDALSHEKNDVLDMVRLYALVARIRLISSRPIVASAERTLDAIIDGYLSPNRTLQDLRLLMSEGKMNFLVEFSEACRVELDGAGRRGSRAAN
ncbi:MAG: hypothetical protein JWR84_1783 [Caulobacter sp.]|nr:hypothetical protein [Caulobacter sp.]